LKTHRCGTGQDGQQFYEGDIVQTRRNNASAGVDNRDTWIVKKNTSDKIWLTSASDSTAMRQVSPTYAESHLHLGYATTIHGIQGETTDRSLVGPGVDAAGLYVGLTRGRDRNDVIIASSTTDSAEHELVEIMRRGEIEETLQISREAAWREHRLASHAPDSSIPAPTGVEQSAYGPSL
jgi:ATP-dependent exoDNAse (exonuclease V) alpha subunit